MSTVLESVIETKVNIFNHNNFDWIERILFDNVEGNEQKLKRYNVTFTFENINRLQSTLLCELQDSYTQQSQRYVKASSKDGGLNELEKKMYELYEEMTVLKDGFDTSKRPTAEDFEYGIPYEDARYILPLSAKTNLIMTIQGNKIKRFLDLIIRSEYKTYFKDIVESLKEWADIKNCITLSTMIDTLSGRKGIEIDTRLINGTFEEKIDSKELVSLAASFSTNETINFERSKNSKAAEFVMGYGHTSIAEHSFLVTKTRFLTLSAYHQLIRHRHLNLVRSPIHTCSTKYSYLPDSIRRSEYFREKINNLFDEIELYHESTNDITILPNACAIGFIITANYRAIGEFLKLRLCNNAQHEIRELANELLDDVLLDDRFMLGDYKPNCCTERGCTEGKLSCGKPLTGNY